MSEWSKTSFRSTRRIAKLTRVNSRTRLGLRRRLRRNQFRGDRIELLLEARRTSLKRLSELASTIRFACHASRFNSSGAGRSPSSEDQGQGARLDLLGSRVDTYPATDSRNRCIPSAPLEGAEAPRCVHQCALSNCLKVWPSPYPREPDPPGASRVLLQLH